MLAAAELNPGYAHRRDYLSVLAARGVEHPWLGIAAITTAGIAIVASAALLRAVSRAAALLVALAGVGFVVAAFARINCSNGAAGCGIGGRFDVSGAPAITHWTFTTVSTILLVAGMVVVGVMLLRRGRTLAGGGSVGAAAVTAGAFLAAGGDSPGAVQRLGVLVATGWLAAVAVAELRRPRAR